MTLLHNNQQNQQITPYERFYLLLGVANQKKQYPNRLQKFLDFLEIEGMTIEERCQKCYNLIKSKTSEENEDLLLKFMIFQNKRIERKEIGSWDSHKLHEIHKTIFQNESHTYSVGYGEDNYSTSTNKHQMIEYQQLMRLEACRIP